MNATLAISIYVDVDDTFVRSEGPKRMPMPAVIAHLRSMHQQGARLYCWSAGGAEYAQRSAEEFGLADCFVAFLPKPNVLIDDQTISDWPRCMMVHPSACADRSVRDYEKDLQRH
jgi:predicted HAD superfamily phosphohydrolase YqeG